MEIAFEIIGYVGTAFVLLSFLMTSVVRLRVLNTVGSLVSLVYLLVRHAYPTAFMNAALVVINLIHLFRMYNQKAAFTLSCADIHDSLVKFFLDKNKGDIALFFPDFAEKTKIADFVKIVWCKNEIAGIFAGKKDGNALDILLDYTTAGYRDCSAGALLFAALKDDGFQRLTFRQNARNHEKYLEKMGFRAENGIFIKEN